MNSPAARHTIRISDPEPFGDVTLVPRQVSGYPEADLARSMADALIEAAPASHSEALRILRAVFPNSPLTVRVAVLGALMRDHIPR